ncbi:hypothetical protein MXB_4067, partial [Myxobolus squamalis]
NSNEALRFIDHALESQPENPQFLELKAKIDSLKENELRIGTGIVAAGTLAAGFGLAGLAALGIFLAFKKAKR